MASTYKVHYFDFTGKAEPIRMILSYGKLDFEDVRVSREEFQKLKPTLPFGQLPVLEFKGHMIPQSTAICRFLANKANLSGKDEFENLRIDVAVDTLDDLKKKVADWALEKNEEKKKALEEITLKEHVPYFLKKLEIQAEKNGGYLALNRISWADIMFICAYESLGNMLKEDILNDYPNLTKVKQNILEVPSIKEWIKKRPTNPRITFDLKSQV